jgi:hypothetical protein
VCHDKDPTIYTIQQDVYDSQTSRQIFSAIYCFRYDANVDASSAASTSSSVADNHWQSSPVLPSSRDFQFDNTSRNQSQYQSYTSEGDFFGSRQPQLNLQQQQRNPQHQQQPYGASLSSPMTSTFPESLNDFADLEGDVSIDMVDCAVPQLFIPTAEDFLCLSPIGGASNPVSPTSSSSSPGSIESWGSDTGDYRSPPLMSDSEEVLSSPTSACLPSSISYYVSTLPPPALLIRG